MGNPFERMPPKDIERAECPNCEGSGYVEDSKGNSKTTYHIKRYQKLLIKC